MNPILRFTSGALISFGIVEGINIATTWVITDKLALDTFSEFERWAKATAFADSNTIAIGNGIGLAVPWLQGDKYQKAGIIVGAALATGHRVGLFYGCLSVLALSLNSATGAAIGGAPGMTTSAIGVLAAMGGKSLPVFIIYSGLMGIGYSVSRSSIFLSDQINKLYTSRFGIPADS